MSRDGMAGPGGPTVFQDPSGNWQLGFHAWTRPYIGYVVVGDLRYTRTTSHPADHLPERRPQPEDRVAGGGV